MTGDENRRRNSSARVFTSLCRTDMQRRVRRSIRVRARRVALLGLLRMQLVSSDGRSVERLERLLGHQEIHVGDEAEIFKKAAARRVGDSKESGRQTGEKAERRERGGEARWGVSE